jgi:hypothetical protein
VNARRWQPRPGLRLVARHPNQTYQTAVVVSVGEVFRRGVRFPFATQVTIRYPDEMEAGFDLTTLRSQFRPDQAAGGAR